MAKLTFNSTTSHLRGRVGDLIYKQYGDKVVVTRVPRFSKKSRPTAKQKPCRDHFRAASDYAMKVAEDKALFAAYVAQAKKRRRTARSIAMGDYMSLPKIERVDLSACSGEVGERIAVSTGDSFKVVRLDVLCRNAAGVVIEGGLAQRVGRVWHYFTTQRWKRGDPIAVEVTVTDRPGHIVRVVTPAGAK